MEIQEKVIDLTIGKPHMMIRLVKANNTFVAASRGAHKTTRIAPFFLSDCIQEMPGSLGCIVGPSYEHLEKNTINPLFQALAEIGYKEDEDYVAKREPPAEWDKPLVPVISKNFKRLYTFKNGTTLMEISMEVPGTANGQSFQFGLFDETKLYSEKELEQSVYKAFRGSPVIKNLYGRKSLYLSKLHLTDKLASPDKINWILEKKELNNWDKLNWIIQAELHLQNLLQQYDESGKTKQLALLPIIEGVENLLNEVRRDTTFYVEANHTDVIKVLGEVDGNIWLKNQEMNSTTYEFKVAILNEDPDRPEQGFYPDFSKEKHVHHLPDYESNQPIILAADYQHSVSPILLAQFTKLGKDEKHSLCFIDEIYTLAPQGLDDAVQQFCERYKNHHCKTVFYVYDQTAIGKRMNAKKYNETVIDILREHKWNIIKVYIGQQPHHYDKYKDTKTWLKEEDKTGMPIRVNSKCVKAIKSIEGAAAKSNSKGETEKEKKYENTTNYPGLDQSETTHFSDVFDMILDAAIKKDKIPIQHASVKGDLFR